MTPDRRDAIWMALAGALTPGVFALGPPQVLAVSAVTRWMPLVLPALLAVGLGVYEGRRRRAGKPRRGVGAWLPAVGGLAVVVAGALAWSRWQHPAGPDSGVAVGLLVAGLAVVAALVAALTLGVARAVGGRG